jgi:hypothetical protein
VLLDSASVKGRVEQDAGGVKIVVRGRRDNVDVRIEV